MELSFEVSRLHVDLKLDGLLKSARWAGTFLDTMDMDEVMFGNVFEKPIRNSLPWGTAVGVKFIQ